MHLYEVDEARLLEILRSALGDMDEFVALLRERLLLLIVRAAGLG